MCKVVVIGGGASGIIASLRASDNNEVILLEKNDKCGKKILLTGNGKCNYWNSDIDISKYHTDSVLGLEEILSNRNDVYNYLTSLGIYPKIKNGYYYPNSNQASSIREILCKELSKNNVNVVYNCQVEKIEKENDKFIIYTNIDNYICDKVIIALGGASSPKSGTCGDGYKLLNNIHTINKVLPSLVPLIGDGNYYKDWNNIRVDAKLDLYVNSNYVDSEVGELQLTDYGISGIPTFNLSGLANKNIALGNDVNIVINFLPDIDNVFEFLNNRSGDTIEEIFESVLPYQLVFTLFKLANIDKNDNWNKIDDNKKNRLCSLISNFNFKVISSLDFDRSQVSIGGVSLKEINPKTMESLKMDNLYIVGEIIDVDGKCGGYNLAFAFITGYLAGGKC